jgi:DNA-binding Lrp family transcriptional regulator
MTSAFLLINSDFLFTEEVTDKLKEIPEIVDIYIVQGLYDIIAKVKLNSEDELKELVSEGIRKVDKITGTVTVIIAGDKQ